MEAIPPAVIENWRAVAEATTCARAETAPAASRIENTRAADRLIGKRCFQSGRISAVGEDTSVVPGLESQGRNAVRWAFRPEIVVNAIAGSRRPWAGRLRRGRAKQPAQRARVLRQAELPASTATRH